MKEKYCTSCKKSIKNDAASTIFPCPSCGVEVVRCIICRKTSVKYKCKCGFEGP